MKDVSLVGRLSTAKALVVGDVMLDRYLYGTVERLNPEGPGTVFRVVAKDERLGGAAAVAWLLRGFGAQAALVGAVGDDREGRELDRLCGSAGIAGALVGGLACTTVKERRVADGFLLHDRVDRDGTDGFDELRACHELDRLCRSADWQVVVVSDYGKGVCSDRVLARVMSPGFSSTPTVFLTKGK